MGACKKGHQTAPDKSPNKWDYLPAVPPLDAPSPRPSGPAPSGSQSREEHSWIPFSSFITAIPGCPGKSLPGDALEESSPAIRAASFPSCYFIKSLKDTSLTALDFFFFHVAGAAPTWHRHKPSPQVQSCLASTAPPGIRDNWDERLQRSRRSAELTPLGPSRPARATGTGPGDNLWPKARPGPGAEPGSAPEPVRTRRGD